MNAARTLDTLRTCLRRHNLYRRDARLVAAVSGGSDSMALLTALSLLQEEIGYSLHACHIQHGLRGEDSLADEHLVRIFCQRFGIPLTVHTAQLGGDLHLPGMETRARECRRAFFAKTMQSLSADALLLAHHQDDQAETVLLHLLRGAGTNGLSGMQETVPFAGGLLLRPFLSLSKADLRAALAQWQIPHREDASNQEALTPRNALRLTVLPRLEALFPGCTSRLSQTASLLRRDEKALSDQANALMATCLLSTPGGIHALLLPSLQSAAPAVAIRILRQWFVHGLARDGMKPEEQGLSARDSEALLALVTGPTAGEDIPPHTLNLPHRLQAYRGSRWLHLLHQDGTPLSAAHPPASLPLLSLFPGNCQPVITPLEPETDHPIASTFPTFIGAEPSTDTAASSFPITLPGWESNQPFSSLTLTATLETPSTAPDTANVAYLPIGLLQECVLRTPHPGDTIHPLGAPGKKPLRRYLMDRKIDPPFRPHLPVLARGNAVLWIPGLCTAQSLVYQPGQPCLCLTLHQPAPYLPTNRRKGDDNHG